MTDEAKQTIKCPICQSTDWKNVDQYRHKKKGMCLCQHCGFVSYPNIIAKSKDLQEFYRKDYRTVPTIQNVMTGERKLAYHAAFLKPLFEKWQKYTPEPKVCEIGGAMGMFLKWLRDGFPKADLYGTELTTSFKRVAWHEYQIRLEDDFDDTRDYDMIASYKVAEHQPHIDQELKRYHKALLNKKGVLYISIPSWFGIMTNFGMDGFDLEYYYSTNHINVWTRQLFETLLHNCGFKIIQENHDYYDDTYLCLPAQSVKPIQKYEDPKVIEQSMDRIKKASVEYDQGKFHEAMNHWPAFPLAWRGMYESNRKIWHEKLKFQGIYDAFLMPMNKLMPETAETHLLSADICMRYSQWKMAISHLENSLLNRPNNPAGLMNISTCYRKMADLQKDPSEKIKWIKKAREISTFQAQVSTQTRNEAINWVFRDHSQIPTPFEKETKPVAQSKERQAV